MTVKKLKEKCKKNGLKISGTKSELIARLKKPTKSDTGNTKPKTIRISLGWGNSNAKSMSSLVERGFARLLYYATDNFIYEVNKEKWVVILSNKK